MTAKRRSKDRRRRRRRKDKEYSYDKGYPTRKPETRSLTGGTPSGSNGRQSMSDTKFEITCEVKKVDAELGLVFGWAIVCKEAGRPYFDLQGDHIPEGSMLKAATGFAKGARMAKEMHVGGGRGTVVFMLPFTEDIAKSLGIQDPARTGLIIGMAPDGDMLEKFKSGELRGFSIGGRRKKDVPAS